MTQKTQKEKRQEAFNRLVKSCYENSKAKRNGVDKETWQHNKDKLIEMYQRDLGVINES